MRPFLKKSWYGLVLTMLMGTSVGILSSTSLLLLLPEALEMNMSDEQVRLPYIYKMIVFFSTFIIFFNFEIIYERILHRKSGETGEETNSLTKPQRKHGHSHEMTETPCNNDDTENSDVDTLGTRVRLSTEEINRISDAATSSQTKLSLVWLIMTGDSVHSFGKYYI